MRLRSAFQGHAHQFVRQRPPLNTFYRMFQGQNVSFHRERSAAGALAVGILFVVLFAYALIAALAVLYISVKLPQALRVPNVAIAGGYLAIGSLLVKRILKMRRDYLYMLASSAPSEKVLISSTKKRKRRPSGIEAGDIGAVAVELEAPRVRTGAQRPTEASDFARADISNL